MMESDVKDILGIKPVSNAIEKTTDGLGAFLGKICMPVAEELGLYFQDHVKAWRATNAIEVAKKSEIIVEKNGGHEGKSVHPLLAWKIMESASFADNDELQDCWAGMLASSCTEAEDDSNHIFIDILSQLTKLQVKIISYACETSSTYTTEKGFLFAEELTVDIDNILIISESSDLHRVDRELDRLSSLGLIGGMLTGGGFDASSGDAYIKPTPLCLQFYARCKGHYKEPSLFYNAKLKKDIK